VNKMSEKMYTLLDANRKKYKSATPGKLGGNGKAKIYGRLDCPAALRAIRQGGYVESRVFFADEEAAIAAGYRPCGACMREKYKKWKAEQGK
jgi:methylphosphotriester-DNA--protein-cysteine methyltransferase